MFPHHRSELPPNIAQETTTVAAAKPPVPTFRKKTPVSLAQSSGGDTDRQTAESSSELSAAFNKIHRRTQSSGSTIDTPDKSEPQSAMENTARVQKEVPVEKDQVKPVRKSKEQASSAEGTGERTTAVKNSVDIKPRLRPVQKPALPAKVGELSEKIDGAVRPPRVAVKQTLSEPGSTSPMSNVLQSKQERAETNGENFAETGKRFQTLEIPSVKLKSISPTPNTELGKRPAGTDIVGVEMTGVEKDGKPEDVPVSTEHRMERKLTAKHSVESNPPDSSGTMQEAGKSESKTTTLGSFIRSANSAFKTVSNATTVTAATESVSVSENTHCPSESRGKSEQTSVKLRPVITTASSTIVSSQKPTGFRVTRTTWEQKVASGTTAKVEKSTVDGSGSPDVEKKKPEDCKIVAEERSAISVGTEGADSSFVPVSKRATMFGSSVQHSSSASTTTKSERAANIIEMKSSSNSRQFVGKTIGSAAKVPAAVASGGNVQTDSSQTTDTAAGSNLNRMAVGSQADSTSDDDLQAVNGIKTSVAKKTEIADRVLPSTTSSVQSTPHATCEAKNERVIRAAAISRWEPAKSDSKTSTPPWVKPSVTSSPKNLPKDSLVKTTPSAMEPEQAAVSQKLSLLSTRSLSPKNAPKSSPQEASNAMEVGKDTGSSLTVQSTKSSAIGMSASATATNVKSAVATAESTSSVSKDLPSSVEGVKPSDLAGKPTRNFRSIEATAKPVTSSEPPWTAIAREKTRVWTDGKV